MPHQAVDSLDVFRAAEKGACGGRKACGSGLASVSSAGSKPSHTEESV